jgi:hypothetical protein
MKITNRLGLPESLVRAVSNDRYSRGDAHISVTGLISPARKRYLEHLHAHEITEDVTERIWALMGQITHGILERADDQAWCEERLFIERFGWRISGQFDRYLLDEDGRCQDYKLTSTYSIKDGVKPEWEAQENIYGLMLREHGYHVSQLEIVAILRDWQQSKAKHTQDYPQVPALVIPVKMWPKDETEAFIKARLNAHSKAHRTLPECTADERWERRAVYALHKIGNKRATKLFDSEDEAVKALEQVGKGHEIQQRPAEQRRCEDYCPALPFCTQGQQLIKQTEEHRLQQLWSVSAPRASAAIREKANAPQP